MKLMLIINKMTWLGLLASKILSINTVSMNSITQFQKVSNSSKFQIQICRLKTSIISKQINQVITSQVINVSSLKVSRQVTINNNLTVTNIFNTPISTSQGQRTSYKTRINLNHSIISDLNMSHPILSDLNMSHSIISDLDINLIPVTISLK